MLQLQAGLYTIIIENYPLYGLSSVVKREKYQHEYQFGDSRYLPTSEHGVFVLQDDMEIASCILRADGGATGIHEHSAIIHGDSCVIAVGPYLCCLEIPAMRLLWSTQVDWATCFGIYHAVKHRCYVSHGELAIARISYSGEIDWSVSGGDIFSKGFTQYEDFAEIVDFNKRIYRIDIASGEIQYAAQ